jgi:hypothetical protein
MQVDAHLKKNSHLTSFSTKDLISARPEPGTSTHRMTDAPAETRIVPPSTVAPDGHGGSESNIGCDLSHENAIFAPLLERCTLLFSVSTI